MLLFLFLRKISSETIEYSDNVLRYSLFDNEKASVLGRVKSEKIINLTIPQNVEYKGNNYTVISIADNSFPDNATYGTLTLPDSLQYIGKNAFSVSSEYQGSDKLVGITGELIIPASITEIGAYAFYNTAITSLKILSNKITKISDWTFAYGTRQCKVVLPDSIEEIGNSAFRNTNISKINFPSSLRIIGDHAFEYFSWIVNPGQGLSCNITIPASVTKIGAFAFYGTSITSLNFSKESKITEIKDNTFAYSARLEEVVLPESIKKIGRYSFLDTNISKIIFPSSLEIIEDWAFTVSLTTNNVRGLSCDITIPESVTYIGVYAFSSTSITSLKILSNKITEINTGTFSKCYQLQTEIIIPNSTKEIYSSAFANSSITSVVFGNNLVKLNGFVFIYCNNLKHISSFPKSLIYIGDYCFYSSQISGTIDGNNLEFIGECSFSRTHITGFIFSFKTKKIPESSFEQSDLSGEIILPETIEEIGKQAFKFTQITKINFPNSLKTIGDEAFYSCNKLINYVTVFKFKYIGDFAFYDCRSFTGSIKIDADFIGESAFKGCSNIVTMEVKTNSSIEYETFEYCTSLKSIKISSLNNSVEFIGEEAFAYCTSLEEIILPEGIKEIKNRAFYMCSSYSGKIDLTIYPNLTKVGDEAYFGCSRLFGEISFPDSLTTICNGTFTGCHITGSLVIPNNVKTIGPYAFFECTKLNGIISIGDRVTEIGDSAFALCSSIAGNIIFGQNVSIIHKRAFFGCSSITGNLILPKSIREIRDAAFYNCAALKGTLNLPNNLQIIGDNAFAECKGLSGRLTIPKSVESVGKNAFFNCKGIEDVYFENSSTKVGYFAFSNMHIKCFSGAPENVRTNDPEIYSSDNFKGLMLPESFLNFYCPSFYVIDGILVGITALASTGVLSAVGLFVFNMIMNKKTNVSKYKEVFKEIIENTRQEKDIHENEITRRIISKINERLYLESKEDDFTMTSSQANDALNKSLEETWPTILSQQKRTILEKSFNDISFKDRWLKCKCKSKNSKQRGNELTDEQSENTIMSTLL